MNKIFKLLRKALREILRYLPIKKAINNPILYGELLKNRVALITGGTSGIGYAIANCFIKNGAIVVITGRNEIKIEEAVKELKEENNNAVVYGFKLDNSKIEVMENKFQNILNNIDGYKIDILVNIVLHQDQLRLICCWKVMII